MNRKPTVLLVEDDEILAASLTTRLSLEGMVPVLAASCEAAIEALERRSFDAVVSDIRLPDGSGEDIFWSERARFAMTPTIFATAYGDVEQAVRLVKLGAIDYLAKPYDLGTLVALLRRVTGGEITEPSHLDDLVAVSPAMGRVMATLERIADTSQNVMFVGPSGSGRQTLARRLHDSSTRRDQPFVVLEGAALGANGGDRLLFGGKDPAGAIETGVLDEVGTGTLLITGIADIAPECQGRLLRFVDEHRYRPVGLTGERAFAGRILSTMGASAADPAPSAAVRPDLLHRLGVIEVRVPALAERKEDILPLAERMLLAETARSPRAEPRRFSGDAVDALEAHDWPGNLRELRNRIARAAALAAAEAITPEDLFPDQPVFGRTFDHKLDNARRDAERQVIEAALAENGGRIVETAKALGISRVTLWSKMKRFDIAKS